MKTIILLCILSGSALCQERYVTGALRPQPDSVIVYYENNPEDYYIDTTFYHTGFFHNREILIWNGVDVYRLKPLNQIATSQEYHAELSRKPMKVTRSAPAKITPEEMKRVRGMVHDNEAAKELKAIGISQVKKSK